MFCQGLFRVIRIIFEAMKKSILKLLIALVFLLQVIVPVQAQIGAERTDPYEMIEVEKKAEFPGGEEVLLRYISEKLEYPMLCIDCDCEGSILVEFIIERDGSVSNVKTVRNTCTCENETVKVGKKKRSKGEEQYKDCSPACAEMQEAAERVVRELPNWSPATQRGKTVRMRYRLPLQFKLA